MSEQANARGKHGAQGGMFYDSADLLWPTWTQKTLPFWTFLENVRLPCVFCGSGRVRVGRTMGSSHSSLGGSGQNQRHLELRSQVLKHWKTEQFHFFLLLTTFPINLYLLPRLNVLFPFPFQLPAPGLLYHAIFELRHSLLSDSFVWFL